MKLQIPLDHLDLIRGIVYRHVDAREHQPVIFGSRANGTAQTYSDVDLGLLGDQPINKQAYIRMVDELEESSLPYKVDVVDFATAEDSFKKIALKNYQKI